MGKIVINQSQCEIGIANLKKIQDEVSALYEYDADAILNISSGESVEKIKKIIEDMYLLKNDMLFHMQELTIDIETYVSDHMELDEVSSKKISKNLG